jgi:hypothetical protein
MSTSSELLKQLAREVSMLPQEQTMEVDHKGKELNIGIPKEVNAEEHRVPLTPASVAVLTARGHNITIQRGVGASLQFQDSDYSEAGAKLADDAREVFEADLILKVSAPTEDEIALLRHKQILISALQMGPQHRDTLRSMMEKKVTAVAWDFIKDREGIYPIIRAMGEIAGTASVQIAAEYLSTDKAGQGLMLGGISGVAPAEVVVIGAGTVGEFATRAALGVGASVKVFDKSIYRLRRLQSSIGQRLWTSIIQPDVLKQALIQADVAIGALRPSTAARPWWCRGRGGFDEERQRDRGCQYRPRWLLSKPASKPVSPPRLSRNTAWYITACPTSPAACPAPPPTRSPTSSRPCCFPWARSAASRTSSNATSACATGCTSTTARSPARSFPRRSGCRSKTWTLCWLRFELHHRGTEARRRVGTYRY